jgi:hypothetical protein
MGLFKGCTNLTHVDLPPALKNIYKYAFEDCTNLSAIDFPPTLERIWDSSFSGCRSLSSIDIPYSVRRIDDYAFSGCSSLKNVTVHWASPLPVPVPNDYTSPGVESSAFARDLSIRRACTLHVPAGTKALYQAAAVWKDFGTIVEQYATGIQPVIQEEEKVTEYYDLLGRRVIHPQKGQLYVTNLRKIILYK